MEEDVRSSKYSNGSRRYWPCSTLGFVALTLLVSGTRRWSRGEYFLTSFHCSRPPFSGLLLGKSFIEDAALAVQVESSLAADDV